MIRRIVSAVVSTVASAFRPCNAGWPQLGSGSIDDSGDLWRRDIRKTIAA